MNRYFIVLLLCLFLIESLSAQVNGTSGLPIGGIGTGAIKYNGGTGNFAVNFISPTRNGDYKSLSGTQFQLFTNRNNSIVTNTKLRAKLIDDAPDDDAIFPRHTVNYGEINGVDIKLNSYIPYDANSIDDMCHPGALYEFRLTNKGSDNVIAAIAFNFNTSAVPIAIENLGFITPASDLQFCLVGKISDGSGTLSYGKDNGFFTDGICNNQLSGNTNKLALRVSLNPSEEKVLRFVLSWYRMNDLSHYYYTNLWSDARQVAESALNNFDVFKSNADELISRMRDSNLPAWIIDHTLNSLVNLVNNSVYLKDGRYCHTEGQWTPEGTMDQMWHSRQIYIMINPDLSWKELEWWARTQHVQNYAGQIHHDFGENFNYVSSDNTEHTDYREIHEWVDLNCAFIISVYETFIATANSERLDYFWPYVKKAAQRILDQLESYGDNQYPYTFSTSLSTYDAGGNSQAYNSGLSIVTYNIMNYLAEVIGEQATADVYADAFQKAKDGFEQKYLDNSLQTGSFCESAIGGPWISNYLKMGPFWEKNKLDKLYQSLINYYNPLTNGMGFNGGSYSEWSPYLISHLGGYALQTNRINVWESLQKDMYERNYLNRNLVFNQQLGINPKVTTPVLSATSVEGTNQYISIPVLWRNYFNIAGYHYNKHSGELWLEPKIIDKSTPQLKNVLLITPEGYAEINYDASGESLQNQLIVFKPDNTINVTSLFIQDLYADSANAITLVKVNGLDMPFVRTGNGTRLKLDWRGSITSGGITIQVEGYAKPGAVIPSAPKNFQGIAQSPSKVKLTWQHPGGDIAGYTIELKTGNSYKHIVSLSSDDTSFIETGLLPEKEYIYRISSFNTESKTASSEDLIISTERSNNGKILIALNAGGNNYTAGDGTQYLSDASSGWVTGGTAYSVSSAIANTNDDALYQSERYGNFNYSIPISNGNYNLVLKFAEIYQDAPGSRLFNVNVEGKEELHNMDIYLRTGKNAAYDVVIPVEIKNGNLNINFISISDNAKLSALEIREIDTTSVGVNGNKDKSETFFLFQNYPNPFNPVTAITYSIGEPSSVKLNIYNLLGEEVKTLINEFQNEGRYTITWDAKDKHLQEVSSGIYFYSLSTGNKTIQKKMILIR